jgi:hypothetical protein
MFVNIPPVGGGGSGEDTLLRGKTYASLRFYSISAGTSGTLTKPASSTIKMDGFGSGADCAIVQEASGKPTDRHALTSANEIISGTLDSSGNWTISGTPSSYPVSLVYLVEQDFSDFDSTSSDILEYWEINNQTNIQVFTSSGTWTKPDGAKVVETILLGGGGGGGSGRCDVAGTVRCAGGGGASSLIVTRTFDASLLTSTVAVTVGAGGLGAAGKTTVGDGNPGTNGGDTTFGTYLKALGGGGGQGGTASSGTGGSATVQQSGPWNSIQRGGGNASATGTNGTAAGNNDIPSPTGGGGGGGVSAANASGQGNVGGTITANISDQLNIAGGLAGAAAPANGGDGNNATWIYGLQLGTGGGGSRGGVSTNSGNGGNGGKGAGGGGAGGVTSGFTGGDGGRGGDGWAVVITYF